VNEKVATRGSKLNLQPPINDGRSLSNQLIHPWLGDRAVAVIVYVNPVSVARRLSVNQHAKSHGPSAAESMTR
jgi:hypothetical protein